MPEQFDENQHEAEAVAMAEPKPKPSGPIEVIPNAPLAVLYLLSQKLLSKSGVILRQIPTVSDLTGDYAIIHETEDEVMVADVSTDHQRSCALQSIRNLEEAKAQRLAQRRAAEAAIRNYEETLERGKAEAERQAAPYPEHIEAAILNNIEDNKATVTKFQGFIDTLDAQLEAAHAELAAVPPRKVWIARLPV